MEQPAEISLINDLNDKACDQSAEYDGKDRPSVHAHDVVDHDPACCGCRSGDQVFDYGFGLPEGHGTACRLQHSPPVEQEGNDGCEDRAGCPDQQVQRRMLRICRVEIQPSRRGNCPQLLKKAVVPDPGQLEGLHICGDQSRQQ